MANLNSYQLHRLYLGIGAFVELNVTGEYIGCIKSNGKFRVGVDNNTRQPIEQGLTFRTTVGDRFNSIQIENTSDVVNEIELAIGDGQVTDSRLSLNSSVNINGISDLVTVWNTPPANFVADYQNIAPSTVFNIWPVENQRELIIQADYLNTSKIYVGDEVQGLILRADDSITLHMNAKVVVRNNSVESQKVRILKIGH